MLLSGETHTKYKLWPVCFGFSLNDHCAEFLHEQNALMLQCSFTYLYFYWTLDIVPHINKVKT